MNASNIQLTRFKTPFPFNDGDDDDKKEKHKKNGAEFRHWVHTLTVYHSSASLQIHNTTTTKAYFKWVKRIAAARSIVLLELGKRKKSKMLHPMHTIIHIKTCTPLFVLSLFEHIFRSSTCKLCAQQTHQNEMLGKRKNKNGAQRDENNEFILSRSALACSLCLHVFFFAFLLKHNQFSGGKRSDENTWLPKKENDYGGCYSTESIYLPRARFID